MNGPNGLVPGIGGIDEREFKRHAAEHHPAAAGLISVSTGMWDGVVSLEASSC